MSNTVSMDKLNMIGVDGVIDMIYDGHMLTHIARKAGVSRSALGLWLAHPDRSARVAAARLDASEQWDDKAEQVLLEARDRDEIARARELAQHYRWRASKLAPKTYGDRITQEHSGPNGQPIQVMTGVPTAPLIADAQQVEALPQPMLLDVPAISHDTTGDSDTE